MDGPGALARSHAGLRLIAQCSLLRRGDEARLAEFAHTGYTEAALQRCSARERMAALQADEMRYGPLRPAQVLALEPHRALLLLQARQPETYLLCELAVEEDYPHRITEFSQREMEQET